MTVRDEGAVRLAEACAAAPLGFLSLTNNMISETGVLALLDAVERGWIGRLRVLSNPIGSMGQEIRKRFGARVT
jgi:hypothetical protein